MNYLYNVKTKKTGNATNYTIVFQDKKRLYNEKVTEIVKISRITDIS